MPQATKQMRHPSHRSMANPATIVLRSSPHQEDSPGGVRALGPSSASRALAAAELRPCGRIYIILELGTITCYNAYKGVIHTLCYLCNAFMIYFQDPPTAYVKHFYSPGSTSVMLRNHPPPSQVIYGRPLNKCSLKLNMLLLIESSKAITYHVWIYFKFQVQLIDGYPVVVRGVFFLQIINVSISSSSSESFSLHQSNGKPISSTGYHNAKEGVQMYHWTNRN